MTCYSLLSTVGVILFGFFKVEGGYNWDCNHYSSYTTDVCYSYSYSVEYMYKCNGTNSINFYQYNSGDCGNDNGIPTSVTNYKSIKSNAFQCDQSKSCDYNKVVYYSDEECNGDSYYDWEYYINDECYPSSYLSFVSYKYFCNDNTLETTTYASGNCTGHSVTTKTVFDDTYNALYKGCYNLVCVTSNGSSSNATFIFGVEWWVALLIGILFILLALCIVFGCCVYKRKMKRRNNNDIDEIPIEMVEQEHRSLANQDHLNPINSNEGITVGETGNSNFMA